MVEVRCCRPHPTLKLELVHGWKLIINHHPNKIET